MAPQHLEACAAEGSEGGGIAGDEIIFVKSDELLPLQRGRGTPIGPEGKTGAGFHVEILTEQLPEQLLFGRDRVSVSHRCDGATSKIADNARRIIRGGQVLGVSTMMLKNRTKADSSKKRCIILNLQRRSYASAFRAYG